MLAISARTSSGHHLEGSQGWASEGGWPRLWMQGAQFWEPKGPAPPEGTILGGPLKDQARLYLELRLLSPTCGGLGHPLLATRGTATGRAARALKAL